MTTEFFYREVEFLQKYYRVVSLSEAAAILKSGSVTAPTIVLTFDDGYEDNYLNLRAITEACGVPVSLFVSTAAIDSHAEFQHDVKRGMKGFRALSWDQIRSWQSEHVEFGSHTRTHFNCGSTDLYALETEIIGSSDDMQNRLGARPRFFAFPWGKSPNMSAPAVEIATSCYEVCFSTLTDENFAGNGTAKKIAGRKGLPATVWELELTVQSVFEFAQSLRRRETQPEDKTPNS
jgi:peptidoglycan/xylan/chitin deacetylase (PgdA/CDA1 family)